MGIVRLLAVFRHALRASSDGRPASYPEASGRIPPGLLEEYARLSLAANPVRRALQLGSGHAGSGWEAARISGFRLLIRGGGPAPAVGAAGAYSSDGASVRVQPPGIGAGDEDVDHLLVEQIVLVRDRLRAAEAEGRLSKRMRRRLLEDLAARRIELQFVRMTGRVPSPPAGAASVQCAGTTRSGGQCKRLTSAPGGRCHLHAA